MISKILPFKPARADVCLFALNTVLIFFYYHELTVFLAPLQNPVPLEFCFCASLAIGALLELRYGRNRFAFTQLTATILVFLSAVFFAQWLREGYLSFIILLKSEPGIEAIIDRDYYNALTNPAIGYGSCFAVSLSLARLFIWKRARQLLLSIFASGRTDFVCPCCGTEMKK